MTREEASSKVSEFSAAKLIIVIVIATLQAGGPRGGPGTLGDRGDALDLIRQKLVDLRAKTSSGPRPRAGQDLERAKTSTRGRR
jgi:hypothetical protein